MRSSVTRWALRTSTGSNSASLKYKMGKNKKSSVPGEEYLLLPPHPERLAGPGSDRVTGTPIIDTHTHLISTFASYRSKYKSGKYDTVFELVRGLYNGRNVEAIVDVWCEAPVQKIWKEIADSALSEEGRGELWGGINYWFVMGTSTKCKPIQ